MIKAIIFDFFDVIHRDPFQHWLKQNGLERTGAMADSSRLLDLGEISNAEFFKRLSQASGRPAQEVEAVYAETHLVNHELLELIAQLKQSYKLGLLSNSSIEYIWGIIEQHDIAKLFDVITVSADVRLVKPEPAIFHHILSKLVVKPGEAIFIDDNSKNVAAAEAIGIRSLVFTDHASLKRQLADLGITAVG